MVAVTAQGGTVMGSLTFDSIRPVTVGGQPLILTTTTSASGYDMHINMVTSTGFTNEPSSTAQISQ